MRKTMLIGVALALGVVATGCSNKKLIAEKDAQIVSLQDEVAQLQGAVESERARSKQINDELAKALSELRTKESVWMEEKNGLTRITLEGEVAFASGSAKLTTDGTSIVDRIWSVVQNYPDRDILVEGHTDNVPIAEQWQYRFRSNWELSSARAHAVLHRMVKSNGADPSRVAAVGYGEYRPVTSNATAEGRSHNRRVVITIGPRGQMPKNYP